MCMKFGLRNGLYVSEVDAAALCGSIGKNISSDIGGYILATIDTVAKNESARTARDVARAKTVLPLIQALVPRGSCYPTVGKCEEVWRKKLLKFHIE